MLKISNLNVHYGVIHAIKDLSFEVNTGEIVTLIGANGAGKTTTLQTISGLIKASGGKIEFENEDITNLPAPKRVARGICQSPEGRRIFSSLTVEENIELGAYLRRDKAAIREDMESVFTRFPILKSRRKQTAGTLSGGEQQMLAIGRALMSSPKILLLDEPSMGLAPLMVREIFDIVKRINETGTTILVVEQNAAMALAISNRAYVVETGKIVMSGTGEAMSQSDEVIKAYLGG
jgi:branched-chain amino acid transport system ATP-binding protein